ncbi:MAG: hypothetical protein OEY29_12045 [Gammaproteobacteria bacterium]|nr:hypothetical protein [Gammaproteobacteria bacterium]
MSINCIVTILLCLLFQGYVFASANKISDRTHNKLTVIHRLMAEDEHEEALSRLDTLAGHVSSRKYDNAYVQQTYGYLFTSMGRVDDAISAFEKSLAAGVLQLAASNSIMLNLVQLYVNKNELNKSVELFEKWLGRVEQPAASELALGGSVYASYGKHLLAVKYLQQAISISKNPVEPWYQLLVSVYFEMKNYKPAVSVLKKLLTINPQDKNYWLQLSAAYQLTGDQLMALTVYNLAYLKGIIKRENEIMQLAYLYMAENLPLKAAVLLNRSFAKNIVKKSADNLKLLYQAYLAANELELAIAVLNDTYKLYADIDIKIKIGQLYMELEEWASAKEEFYLVLDQDDHKQSAKVYFLAGITNYELKNYNEAIRLLEISKASKEYKRQSSEWVNYISNLKA